MDDKKLNTEFLVLLFIFVNTASALNCYQCGYIRYLAGEPSVDPAVYGSYSYAKTAIGTDTNCLLEGDNYRQSRTTYTTDYVNLGCTTSCLKYTAIASYTINSTPMRYEITYRGCAPTDNFDPKNNCSSTSSYYTGVSQGLLAGSGQNASSFSYDSSVFCYCGSDLCNTASSRAINSAMMVVAVILCYLTGKAML